MSSRIAVYIEDGEIKVGDPPEGAQIIYINSDDPSNPKDRVPDITFTDADMETPNDLYNRITEGIRKLQGQIDHLTFNPRGKIGITELFNETIDVADNTTDAREITLTGWQGYDEVIFYIKPEYRADHPWYRGSIIPNLFKHIIEPKTTGEDLPKGDTAALMDSSNARAPRHDFDLNISWKDVDTIYLLASSINDISTGDPAVANIELRITGVLYPRGGSRGQSGSPGPAGSGDGSPGPDGNPGLPGGIGPTGATGTPGDPGLPGQPGRQGVPGPEGVHGPTGLAGERGRQGVPGPEGVHGPTGLAGERGRQGVPGPEGVHGPTGLAGERGRQGVPGPEGVHGPTGLAGEPGRQGIPGPVGVYGPQGIVGERGRQGLPGPVGVYGPQGIPGQQGGQGPQGSHGTPGPAGIQGREGIPGRSLIYAYRLPYTQNIVDEIRDNEDPGVWKAYKEGEKAVFNGIYTKLQGNFGGLTGDPPDYNPPTNEWLIRSHPWPNHVDPEYSPINIRIGSDLERVNWLILAYNEEVWDWIYARRMDALDEKIITLGLPGDHFVSYKWEVVESDTTTTGTRMPPGSPTSEQSRAIILKLGDPTYRNMIYTSNSYYITGNYTAAERLNTIPGFEGIDTTGFNYSNNTDLNITFERRRDQATNTIDYWDEINELNFVNFDANNKDQNTLLESFRLGLEIAYYKPAVAGGGPNGEDIPDFRIGYKVTSIDSASAKSPNTKVWKYGVERDTTWDVNALNYVQSDLGLDIELLVPGIGPVGDEGPPGPAGQQGLQGITGAQGVAGPEGVHGPQGLAGGRGRQGVAGPEGVHGPQGLAGGRGRQGVAGPEGVHGPQGLAGGRGRQGVAGPEGVHGPQGLAGGRGRQGVPGPEGVHGPQGLAGGRGRQGVPGPEGVHGPQGLGGETGRQGVPGPDGPIGTTGLPGVPGRELDIYPFTLALEMDKRYPLENGTAGSYEIWPKTGENVTLGRRNKTIDIDTEDIEESIRARIEEIDDYNAIHGINWKCGTSFWHDGRQYILLVVEEIYSTGTGASLVVHVAKEGFVFPSYTDTDERGGIEKDLDFTHANGKSLDRAITLNTVEYDMSVPHTNVVDVTYGHGFIWLLIDQSSVSGRSAAAYVVVAYHIASGTVNESYTFNVKTQEASYSPVGLSGGFAPKGIAFHAGLLYLAYYDVENVIRTTQVPAHKLFAPFALYNYLLRDENHINEPIAYMREKDPTQYNNLPSFENGIDISADGKLWWLKSDNDFYGMALHDDDDTVRREVVYNGETFVIYDAPYENFERRYDHTEDPEGLFFFGNHYFLTSNTRGAESEVKTHFNGVFSRQYNNPGYVNGPGGISGYNPPLNKFAFIMRDGYSPSVAQYIPRQVVDFKNVEKIVFSRDDELWDYIKEHNNDRLGTVFFTFKFSSSNWVKFQFQELLPDDIREDGTVWPEGDATSAGRLITMYCSYDSSFPTTDSQNFPEVMQSSTDVVPRQNYKDVPVDIEFDHVEHGRNIDSTDDFDGLYTKLVVDISVHAAGDDPNYNPPLNEWIIRGRKDRPNAYGGARDFVEFKSDLVNKVGFLVLAPQQSVWSWVKDHRADTLRQITLKWTWNSNSYWAKYNWSVVEEDVRDDGTTWPPGSGRDGNGEIIPDTETGYEGTRTITLTLNSYVDSNLPETGIVLPGHGEPGPNGRINFTADIDLNLTFLGQLSEPLTLYDGYDFREVTNVYDGESRQPNSLILDDGTSGYKEGMLVLGVFDKNNNDRLEFYEDMRTGMFSLPKIPFAIRDPAHEQQSYETTEAMRYGIEIRNGIAAVWFGLPFRRTTTYSTRPVTIPLFVSGMPDTVKQIRILLPPQHTEDIPITRGSRHYHVYIYSASLAVEIRDLEGDENWPADWVAYVEKRIDGVPQAGDIVSAYRGDIEDSRAWDPNTEKWIPFTGYIGHNMIVRGTLTADLIGANTLTARNFKAEEGEVDELLADKIKVNSLDGDRIKTKTLTGDKANFNFLNTAKLVAPGVIAKLDVWESDDETIITDTAGSRKYYQSSLFSLPDNKISCLFNVFYRVNGGGTGAGGVQGTLKVSMRTEYDTLVVFRDLDDNAVEDFNLTQLLAQNYSSSRTICSNIWSGCIEVTSYGMYYEREWFHHGIIDNRTPQQYRFRAEVSNEGQSGSKDYTNPNLQAIVHVVFALA